MRYSLFSTLNNKTYIPVLTNSRTNLTKDWVKKVKPVRTIFEYHAEFMIEQGHESQWSDSTYKEHRTIQRRLKDFAPKLEFEDLTQNGLSKFVDYLQTIQVNSKKKRAKEF